MTEVLIIGAGLSGLAAADALLSAGHRVEIIDKGRGVGGRLATRRIGDARLDHGAQFFTVRGDDFRELVERAIGDNVVDVWCHGFDSSDGYPRYFCPHGMTALAKWMAARITDAGGKITRDVRATSIAAAAGPGFDVAPSWHGERVLVTSPTPQTLDLLNAGGLVVEADARARLEAVRYKPTLALLLTLDSPSALCSPGGVQHDESDLFTFVADNALKGISDQPALTLHVNGEVSAARWDDDRDTVIADLLDAAAPFIGSANVVSVELKAWRYAAPLNPLDERALALDFDAGRVVLAGDAFGGPKVEGAFNSGRAAAALLADR